MPGRLTAGFTFNYDVPGDVNKDNVADLKDVILSLKIAANQVTATPLHLSADANNDGRLGLALKRAASLENSRAGTKRALGGGTGRPERAAGALNQAVPAGFSVFSNAALISVTISVADW